MGSKRSHQARMNPTYRQSFPRGFSAEMPELPIQSLQFAHWKTRQRQSENQSTDHRRDRHQAKHGLSLAGLSQSACPTAVGKQQPEDPLQ